MIDLLKASFSQGSTFVHPEQTEVRIRIATKNLALINKYLVEEVP